MARSQRRFRQKFNEALDLLATGGKIDTIAGFAKALDTSRTTARAILSALTETELIAEEKGSAIRPITSADYFPRSDVLETREVLRSACMRWIIQERLQPGTYVDEVKMATRLRIPVSSVHEFLISLGQFGFFRRVRNREWIVEAMNKSFIEQLLQLRMMFEFNSIDPLIALPEDHPFWRTLHRIKKQHLALLEEKCGDAFRFFELDNRLHWLMSSSSDNRLMQIFQEAIFFVFFYHYRWDSSNEKDRNMKALEEHLQFIDALIRRDATSAKLLFRTHLKTAQDTLLNSIEDTPNRSSTKTIYISDLEQ